MAKTGSSVALETYFEEADPRLLGEVSASENARLLGNLAPRWYADPRPEMRRMLLEYVDAGLDRNHHQPLVKRLFKLAEAKRDHEAMAHFLVACDGLMTRRIRKSHRYDWQTRTTTETEYLELDRSIPRGAAPTRNTSPDELKDKRIRYPARFTYSTRRYLQRRAWRYFRELGKSHPSHYLEAIVLALQLYRDETLSDSVQLLDKWGLVHALYHHSPVLEPERPGWTVKPGASLSDLKPAPMFEEVWKTSASACFDLLVRASSRTVRLFAMSMLRAHHAAALEQISFADVKRILISSDEEVQLFAAELLRRARGVELLTVDEWLKLAKIGNASAIPILAELFEKHVRPDRVSTAQAIELARSSAAPIAALGLKWLKPRPIKTGEDLRALLALGSAPSNTVRADAIDWLVGQLKLSSMTTPLHLRELIDAPFADVRQKAIRWMIEDPRFTHELSLWSAMTETPYDDVRATLVRHLEHTESAIERSRLEHVWATVLLAVHRGSRAKARVTKQLADRIIAHPPEAETLLPLLGIALRSLRIPEKKSALAAIGRAAYFASELREKISKHLPGLVIRSGGSS